MIEIYGQSIINLLYAFADPKKVCSKLALCSNLDHLVLAGSELRMRRNTETSELGSKRCTWGDQYSCMSMQSAVECNVRKKRGKLLSVEIVKNNENMR